ATERGRSDSLFIDEMNGILSGGSVGTFEQLSSRTSIETKGTVILGNHKFKVGLEYREISTDAYDLYNTVEQSGDSLYQTHYNLVDGTVGSRIPSAFIQDSWQAHRRWRINAGVRWDGQFMLDSNDDVAQKITDQFQPRVGFVYQPGELGTQKIFGSFGRFYQDIGTLLSAAYHIEGITWQGIKYDHDPRFDSSGGDTLYSMSSSIHPEVDDLEGQHYDEFTLGYERQIGNLWKFGATGVYRTLQQGVEDAVVAAVGDFRYGNPGKGLLSEYPEMKREYAGLVLTAERSGGEHFNFLASYVLSRTEGNYSGLFNQDFGWGQPNFNGDFDILEMTENFDGLLANDRTHKLKFLGSYRTNFGLTMGTFFMWQSGTPKSICEGSSWGSPYWAFVEERGSAGRTPSIWDLNIRFAYDLPSLARATMHPRLLLDVFHLGSQREAVQFDQIRSFYPDGEEPNPTFGLATQYQPPTAVRLGMEVSF
ncbi:MAG: TonB-dependent receptor, partial [Candidatus Latescibacterota bacterium]